MHLHNAPLPRFSQDTVLFNDTVMHNIRYGRFEATDDQVIEAAKVSYHHVLSDVGIQCLQILYFVA